MYVSLCKALMHSYGARTVTLKCVIEINTFPEKENTGIEMLVIERGG